MRNLQTHQLDGPMIFEWGSRIGSAIFPGIPADVNFLAQAQARSLIMFFFLAGHRLISRLRLISFARELFTEEVESSPFFPCFLAGDVLITLDASQKIQEIHHQEISGRQILDGLPETALKKI